MAAVNNNKPIIINSWAIRAAVVPTARSRSSPSQSSHSPQYIIFCDAGSTGTRLYVYSTTTKKKKGSDGAGNLRGGSSSLSSNNDDNDVSIQVGSKVKPGLSSQTPQSAATYLLPSLLEALEMIPYQYHATTPVFVYATGGMRLLSPSKQSKLFRSLVDGLKTTVPFLIDRDNFRTIDGSDEGYYAVLAVNYLSGRLGSDLRVINQSPSKGLVGALDLGGASAQIVFHNNNNNDKDDDDELRSGTQSSVAVRRQDFYSKSILGIGSESIRRSIEKYFVDNNANARPLPLSGNNVVVENPCYFKGYNRTTFNKANYGNNNSITHLGTGHGSMCLKTIDKVMERNYMQMFGADNHQKIQGGEFYAMTLFYHVIHFVRDVLELKHQMISLSDDDREEGLRQALVVTNPSLCTLRNATEYVCSNWDYNFLRQHSHAYSSGTSIVKMPHRCLELCLVVTLLDKFGFDTDSQAKNSRVHFVDSINNHTAEWTLGAFLHQVNNNNNNDGESNKNIQLRTKANAAARVESSSPNKYPTTTTAATWIGFVGLLALTLLVCCRSRISKPKQLKR